ncbi:MAG: hypothetical protein ABW088_15320 [Sedimenticola sp.]
MPYQHRWINKGLYLHNYGILTTGELIKEQQETYNNPKIDDIKYIIFDALNVDQFLINHHDVEHLAAVDEGASSYLKHIKMALVADDEQINKFFEQYIAIARYLESPWKFKIFSTSREAEEWCCQA